MPQKCGTLQRGQIEEEKVLVVTSLELAARATKRQCFCPLGMALRTTTARAATPMSSTTRCALQTEAIQVDLDNDGLVLEVFRAARALAAGEELLIDYGEQWWRDRGWSPLSPSSAASTSLQALRRRMAAAAAVPRH
eukprot:TRINITY_DN6215_c0_g1_i2.p1 TRINITY_DN6215_c0_g1~~TRINITY_DN6215_c0_g1_i2.p1  ORF type:complete len:137 (-),score=32.41 TRINITY_DN6215_c0_g1_i2:20-430(-)